MKSTHFVKTKTFLSGRKIAPRGRNFILEEVLEDGILEIVCGWPAGIAFFQVKRASSRWTVSGNGHMFN